MERVNDFKVTFEGEKFWKLGERVDINFFVLVGDEKNPYYSEDTIWYVGPRLNPAPVEPGTVTNMEGVLALNLRNGIATYLPKDSRIIPVEIIEIKAKKVF